MAVERESQSIKELEPVGRIGSLEGIRVVIKIGSSTITDSESSVDRAWLDAFAGEVGRLVSAGAQVVVVSSGAIACGLERLGLSTRPADMPSLQAAASVGEAALMAAYEEAFSPYDLTTSIVLLTRRDTADREAYLNARETLLRLLELGVVPVVNENDTVSTEQIKFGDNDTLAALVACLVDATMLIILSDVAGLLDADPADVPDASLVSRVEKIDQSVMSVAGGAGSAAGSGGMITKVRAARVMMAAGIPMALIHGKRVEGISECLEDACPGTLFAGSGAAHEITPRKLWVALGDAVHGAVRVDAGAKRALISSGASLLPVGVTEAEGAFAPGDIIDVKDEDGQIIARGIVSAPSDAVRLACGMTTDELLGNSLLKDIATRPLIHRDELMVFE